MHTLQVVELIERTFAGVKREKKPSLHQAQLSDQGIGRAISEEEWRLAGALDTETEWHEVPDSDLEVCSAALSHLTPPNWRYYLPAYMRFTLKHLQTPLWELDVPHFLIHSLTYSDKYPGMGLYHLERFRTLSEPQCAAVREFLSNIAGSECEQNMYSRDAGRALAKYWGLPPELRPNP